MRWRDAKKRRKRQEIFDSFEKENQVLYGKFWARFFAQLMDMFLLVMPITILLGFIFGYEAMKNPELNPLAGQVQMGITLAVTILFWYFAGGQTPGKKALRLKVVDDKSFREPPFWKLVVRYFSYFLSMISIIGFFMPIFRKDKKALHDLVAGTVVIVEN
jgi:uncharacterized RDD family membrane protein YckC